MKMKCPKCCSARYTKPISETQIICTKDKTIFTEDEAYE